jgi:hypothetical protein
MIIALGLGRGVGILANWVPPPTLAIQGPHDHCSDILLCHSLLQDNVGPTVDSVREAMGSRDDYEIVPINDASTDRTF